MPAQAESDRNLEERLNFASEEISWGSNKDLEFVIIASLLAGVIAKLPAVLGINEEFFYPRNIGFIIFPVLSAYFAWKNKLSRGKIAFIAGLTLFSVIFINSLPNVNKSDTLILSCLHLLLFLWSILGFAFVGEKKNNGQILEVATKSISGGLLMISSLAENSLNLNNIYHLKLRGIISFTPIFLPILYTPCLPVTKFLSKYFKRF